jgi:hypothetical protein
MKNALMAAMLVSGVSLSGCATTNPNGDSYYGRNGSASRAATGAAVGAGVGAVAGAIIPGLSTTTGAIAGGIAGAVLGGVINGRQYYRDTAGACYYVDQYNRPIYDYNARC